MGRRRNAGLSLSIKRLVVPSILALAAYYAVFGGEYSAFELRSVRADIDVEEWELSEVQQEIDSLSAWVDLLENDAATIERVAREDFGMIRDGETLYRFAEPDVEPEAMPRPIR
ncbi:MAG: septum formation initiator family protein [Longimicrobiales bacterium]|nr:septum formation initiator family protein [Longimicrobiales bacterium]